MNEWMTHLWPVWQHRGNKTSKTEKRLSGVFTWSCPPYKAKKAGEAQLGGLGVELGKLSLHLPPVAGDLEIIRVVRNFFVD